MDIELEPEQPPEVEQAIAETLQDRGPRPDPWWQAGIDEALEP